MTSEAEREANRVRAVYARRAKLRLDDRYAYWEPANLFIYQERERALLGTLRRNGLLPLEGRRVLDAGCGDGAVLRDLLRYGARPEDICGIDLLDTRVARARELTPGTRIEVGDVQALPFEDMSFDLSLAFTLLSSVTEPEARRRVVAELRRVTRAGGLILVYDFWLNPLNRQTRPLRRTALRELFSGLDVDFQGLTLAPPLLRPLIKAPGGWLACTALEMIPLLRPHYLATVHR